MHPQDRLLLTEALITFAGDARYLTTREQRAWTLADGLLETADISLEALLTQIDEEWSESKHNQSNSQASPSSSVSRPT